MNRRILGRVSLVGDSILTVVLPLYESTKKIRGERIEGTPSVSPLWDHQITNPDAEFPKRGKVAWCKAPKQAKLGTLCDLEIELASKTARCAHWYRVVSVHDGALDVIDLRDLGPKKAWRLLKNQGIELEGAVQGRQLLWIADQWFGPVRLTNALGGRQWHLSFDTDPSKLGRCKPLPSEFRVWVGKSRWIACLGCSGLELGLNGAKRKSDRQKDGREKYSDWMEHPMASTVGTPGTCAPNRTAVQPTRTI